MLRYRYCNQGWKGPFGRERTICQGGFFSFIQKKNPANLFFLSIIFLISTGCVQQNQFLQFQNEVRSNLDRNEAAIEILKKDIFQLHSTGEQEKQAGAKREDDLKKGLADLSANFDELKLEISSVAAQLDESRHFSKRSDKEILGLRKGFSSQIEELNKKQAKLQKDLLALKRAPQKPPRKAPSPPKQPPTVKPETPQKPAKEKAPTPVVADDLKKYKEAKFKFDEGDFAEARKDFQEFLKGFPKSKLSDNAQFWLAECYYREGVYEKAIVEYEKVINNYPEGGKIPSALLKQAMAFHSLEDKDSARFLYQKIIKEFPNASQAAKARYELSRLK